MAAAGRAYVGRFAPSPTGSLHLGSLAAAVASFLDARAAEGVWLVRMEDLDHERVLPGCADQMLRTLEAFGLHWDGRIEYQSRRTEHYESAVALLGRQGLTFQCSCSRRELSDDSGYPGTCRAGPKQAGATATRLRVPEAERIGFCDRLQGTVEYPLAERGDFIIRRRDGVFAYQLAVVVDDALQGVTDVVRGADLLDSTPWQLLLQRNLALPTLRYAHLPLLTEPDGQKLAKARRSVALEPSRASEQLWSVLALLGQVPPAELRAESPEAQLTWAHAHWSPARLTGVREIRLDLGPAVSQLPGGPG